jgi:hypothetical protein
MVSAGIKPREAKPAPPAPLLDETATSEDIYFDASDKKTASEDISNTTDAPATASATVPVAVSAAAPAAAATVELKAKKRNQQ